MGGDGARFFNRHNTKHSTGSEMQKISDGVHSGIQSWDYNAVDNNGKICVIFIGFSDPVKMEIFWKEHLYGNWNYKN